MTHLRIQMLRGATIVLPMFVFLTFGVVSASAQTRASAVTEPPASTTLAPSPVAPASAPVMIAAFTELHRQPDWRYYKTPYACAHLLQRTLNALDVEHRSSFVNPTDTADDENHWLPLPVAAIDRGRQCLQHLPVTRLPNRDLPELFRLAVALNADSLATAVETRRLALAKSSRYARGAVLDSAIHVLMTNSWHVEGYWRDNLTPAHTRLARQYLTQLDSLGPSVVYLRIQSLYRISRSRWKDLDSVVVDNVLETERRVVDLVQHADLAAVPASDRLAVQSTGHMAALNDAWWTYIKTLDHTDLQKFLSMVNASGANTVQGTPAPPIRGGFWFNRKGFPDGDTTTSPIPIPGHVSLIYFFQANDDLSGINSMRGTWDGIRRLHVKYPSLQIILVSAIQGSFRGRNFLGQPRAEAEMIHRYLTDSLQIPGVLCVINEKYRKVIGGHVVPETAPVFDDYHVDPMDFNDDVFLVDKSGWIVRQVVIDPQYDVLIRRLLAQPIPAAATSPVSSPPTDSQRVSVTPAPHPSGNSTATLKPIACGGLDPTRVFFAHISLTVAQRDSLQTLLVNQCSVGTELFSSNTVSDFEGVRMGNRAALRAVLDPNQQKQFDANAKWYDDHRGRVQFSPWW